jgi:uncharacterized integral membrane protein
MPWRLIGFILLFAIFLVFIGFNLDNRCDISVGFHKFDQVPVYLTTFSAFVLGMLWAVPYIFSLRFKRKSGKGPVKEKKKRGQKKSQELAEAEETPPGPGGPYGID